MRLVSETSFRRIVGILVLAYLTAIPGACQTGNDAPPPTLALNDAVQTALAHNRQLQASAHEVGEAADMAASARADLFPVLHVKATGGALLNPLNVRVPAGSLGTVNQAPFPTVDSTVLNARGGLGFLDASLAQPLTQLPAIRLNIRLQQVGVQAAQEQQRGARRLSCPPLNKHTLKFSGRRTVLPPLNKR